MKNRRQHYRHTFTPSHHFSVTLRGPEVGAVDVEVIDLSIGGICVKADGADLAPVKHLSASIPLGPDREPIILPVERIHAGADRSDCGHGYRFLPAVQVWMQEEREKALWKFLLDEQRRGRQRA